MYFSHKKCILQVSPKKTHIIQLLNTKTNYTTDLLGNKFYKTHKSFLLLNYVHTYLPLKCSFWLFSIMSLQWKWFGSATSKILGNFTVWKHGHGLLYHIAEAIRTRKWHIVVNYIQCPKCLCPYNIVVGRQKRKKFEWWGDFFLCTPPSCDALQSLSLCVSWCRTFHY